MKKIITFLFLSLLLPLASLVANADDNPGGYDVQTHLTPPSEVGPIKDATTGTMNDQFSTITQRCEATSIPSNYYATCCQPPYYWLNPACPYLVNNQQLVYDPTKQLETEDENDAYQSTLTCLGSSGSDCANSSAVQNILQNAQNKYDTCKNDCENSYQSCTPGCTVAGTSNGDGPYVDSTANYYYFAVVNCVRSGGVCYRIAPSQYHDVAEKAVNDVQYGTVWQAQQTEGYTDQGCLNSCSSNNDYCTSNCDQQYKDLPDRIRAAAEKATDNWNTIGNLGSSEMTLPPPTPLSNELQKIEDRTTVWPNLEKITDPNGKEIMAQDILRGGLSDDMPIATFKYPVDSFKKGEPIAITVSGGPGETLPIQEVVVTPAEDMGSGSVEVTVSGGTTPKLLGEGAPGTPDYILPKTVPDPQIYELDSYARIGATTQLFDKSDPLKLMFSDTFFRFAIDTSKYKNIASRNGAIVSMLHYNQKTQNWDELSVEKYLCENDGGWCRYTAHSTGNSIFAIVIKKADKGSNVISSLLDSGTGTGGGSLASWIFILVWLVVAILLYILVWRKIVLKFKSGMNSKQKRAILHELGFVKHVFIFGVAILGNFLALIFASIILSREPLTIPLFFGTLFLGAPFGFLVGLIRWGVHRFVLR